MAPTVLILGARSDIGQAVAYLFAKKGFDIQLAARNVSTLAKFAADLKIRFAGNVNLHEFDVLAFDSHKEFVDQLGALPDIVISVVGLMAEQSAAQCDWQLVKLMLDTNFTGPVSILNLFADLFETQNKGVIIGISSVAGDRGRKSNYLYGSAKAGFTAYLSGLRNRLDKSGVQVITVKPGFVKTEMTKNMNLPQQLTASPEQVAQDIFVAFSKRKDIIYSKWFWRWIMFSVKNIPEKLFKKLSL